MPSPETLAHAPITEALVDVQVKVGEGVSYDDLAAFQEGIRDRYPSRQIRNQWTAQLTFDDKGVSTEREHGPVGYLFSSPDSFQVVQARIDGFSFSRLRPYQDWDRFITEATMLWRIYRDLVHPSTITRVGLRYINRIELPQPVTDFKEYLLTVPEIAPGVPQGLSSFLMRMEIPFADRKAIAIVTETIDTNVAGLGKTLPFILDIDVVHREPVNPGDDSLWEVVNNLRTIKNQIFFESITDKAKELFK